MKFLSYILVVVFGLFGFNLPAQANSLPNNYVSQGLASWYGPGFHGRLTASGTRYNMWVMTAAHKTLPFGSKVAVTNVANGKMVIVTITDRGPFVKGRVIDLSKAANQKLQCNLCKVSLTTISFGDNKYYRSTKTKKLTS